MKTIILCLALALVVGCSVPPSKQAAHKALVAKQGNPQPPPVCTTNCSGTLPPVFPAPPINTNELWLSIAKTNNGALVLMAHALKPGMTYWFQAKTNLESPSWIWVTPFQGDPTYSLMIPFLYTKTNPVLYFRATTNGF